MPDKILAISSLPTLGNAGLKNIISVLGTRVLPVPSLLISGLGNMPGHQRFDIPFAELLQQTFLMAEKEDFSLILYTGYLQQAKQVDDIIRMIERYRTRIAAVVVDPVCGDNGRAYVDPSIIERLRHLLQLADWALPNLTELGLLLDQPGEGSLEELTQAFRERYPQLKWVITGILEQDSIANYLYDGHRATIIPHSLVNSRYSGTGDVFAPLFLDFHFFRQLPANQSVARAGEAMFRIIQMSAKSGKPAADLQIDLSSLHEVLTSVNRQRQGKLIYVVGPSGAGKDSLMAYARQHLNGKKVRFVQRYITRPADAGGEAHTEITVEAFHQKRAAGYFALWWESHGNYYGISREIDRWLAEGDQVVVNGSRGYLPEAHKSYPDLVSVLVELSEEVLRE